jgi:hypothetical protein
MRRGFGFIGLLVTLIVLVIVGTIAYNIGWSDGVNTHLPAAGTAADGSPYFYGPHYWGGPGFGFLGIFWFLLILFGIFWLFRLAFWGFAGRRMMGGGWGHGRGWSYGQGGPQSFEERAKEWHAKQHGDQPSTGTTPPPPPDTRSV